MAFDRTNLPSEDMYNLLEGGYIEDLASPPYRRIVSRDCESDTDARTCRICVTLFDSGIVLLWGEDCDGIRTWLRDNDDIAKGAYELHADAFDYDKYPRKEHDNGPHD